MTKLNIGILFGGKSAENEVSFNSGRTVCDHLDKEIFTIVPIFQKKDGRLFILPYKFLHRGKISDFQDRLEKEAQEICWDDLKHLIDFAYITMHGRFAEDGTLQGMLELLQIPYLGAKVLASALSRDKALLYDFLAINNFNAPTSIHIQASDLRDLTNSWESINNRLLEKHLTFPLIVKPYKEGSSIGVFVAKNEIELKQYVQASSLCNQVFYQDVLVEEKLNGLEFTCIIITDPETQTLIPLSVTEIEKESSTEIFDYEQKYMPGRATKHTPARMAHEHVELIKTESVRLMKALGISNTMRVDGFFTPDEKIVFIDVNTITGMAPSSFLFRQAAEHNMSHTTLINTLIKAELTSQRIQFKPAYKEANQMQKIKVAVLFGGRSNEKETSLDSGRNVIYKLSPEKYEILPLFVNKNLELYTIDHKQLVHNKTDEIEESLQESDKVTWATLPTLCDFAFLALHGGEGENGIIQGALEMLGVPYNGSGVFASALSMDKYKTTQFLKSKGFHVPESVLVKKTDWHEHKEQILIKITASIKAPFIAKPYDDGCSVMVSKADTVAELETAIEEILAKKDGALIEQCIVGIELTVGCIGNEAPQALPASQAVAAKSVLTMQEKFLPGAGENKTPAPISQEAALKVKQTIEAVYKAVGCKGYARIDCFYEQQTNNVVIIEINTLPALTPATCLFHQAAELGITPMELIDTIIMLGLKEHTQLKIQENQHILES